MSKPTFLAIVTLLATIAHRATGFIPASQYNQAAVLINDTIYVFGGSIIRPYTTVKSLYSLDISQPWISTNPSWVDLTITTGNSTVPLSDSHAMWPSADGESFYVWGGGNSRGQPLLQSGFAQYNTVTRNWTLPSAIINMPQQRDYISASWTSSGVAYIWAGEGDYYTGRPAVYQTFPTFYRLSKISFS
ncbi:hypothetical protein BC938DRAFT_476333 [Jimgerdemannia flammicorona]|uniref:Galactose oxidase n=1 Tax=Jimgerdemannia flammicorona TaxID=994334 RepID=A0A433QQN6_9FUNG|nr:hypothetical protein BC938DRAFT_476333 [Jimgerdemannia flammicorona]